MKLITLADGVMKGCFFLSSNRSLDLFFDLVDLRLSERLDLCDPTLRPLAMVVLPQRVLASRERLFLDQLVFCDERV